MLLLTFASAVLVQVTSAKEGFALDRLTIETHVTKIKDPESMFNAGEYPTEGVYIHGLYVQGARWMTGEEAVEAEAVYEVEGSTVECAGMVTDSRFKELLPPMPVMYIKAILVPNALEHDSYVGYLRPDSDVYNCPVYATTVRGPTYTFLATLKAREPVSKWTLAGVALVMQNDD